MTSEGLEANLAVNYLSNFLLTTQLLPKLKQSRDGRVLCVNSSLHRTVGDARERFSSSEHGNWRASVVLGTGASELFSLEPVCPPPGSLVRKSMIGLCRVLGSEAIR